MINFRMNNNCIYNMIGNKFNEDINRQDLFYYSLEYPTFYSFKNTYFNVKSNILNNINSTIKADVYNFKDGVLKEATEFNNSSDSNKTYKVFVDYNIPFNKNHVLSSTLSLMGFVDDDGVLYNQLNNYNYDLLTGNKVYLKNIFVPNVDYIDVITNYINYKINQNKDIYYPNINIEIPQDQAFYLTDDGVVIYFGLDEIGPKELGIPKFKMSFAKFAPYINPRFYCEATNAIY